MDITTGSVIAFVGCGGKTSLIELIADQLREKMVLVTTTTKMFPMGMNDVVLCETLEQCLGHEPKAGIQCMGLLNKASGKLEALPIKLLAETVLQYDLALIEADGSKGLPCKGWLASEPVVPPFCTHTVGIITMNPLHKVATDTTVHRLPEFLALTGLKEGEAITMQALEAMVCGSGGMFKSVGSGEWGIGNGEWGAMSNEQGAISNERGRYLIVNQVEDDETARVAQAFLEGIKEKYPGRFKRLLYGSVLLDNWEEV
jgi:probable selenium-dependent hydroxylase accessory protein YqeC